jgi:hypothetical protein
MRTFFVWLRLLCEAVPREDRLIHVLVCSKCGGRTGPNHHLLEGGGATCSLCGAFHRDCKTALSSYCDAASDETLVRMLRYLGATEEQTADYEDQRRDGGVKVVCT